MNDTSSAAHNRKIQKLDLYEWEVYETREMNATHHARYGKLNKALVDCVPYELVFLNEFAPSDAKRKYDFIEGLRFQSKVVRFSHTSTREHLHFVWRVHPEDNETTVLQKNEDVSSQLKSQFPKYFSRAMKRDLMSMAGRVSTVKPAVLRTIFKKITGDSSAETNQVATEVHQRILECIDGEDAELLWDLRTTNAGRPEQYLDFLAKCQEYIASSVETPVDDRRHDHVVDGDTVTHMATALNASDLHKKVAETCEANVAIPSTQWLRWQFWPRHMGRSTSKRYSGRIRVKYMVMARQFRHDHIDSYYASALWKYQKEFAVKYRKYTEFLCQDDKHTVKVGEPGVPVAAVERGREVLVGKDQKFKVADHDFCKFSITPSVSFKVSIPEDMKGNFYSGTVYVGLKDNVFEPSTSIRHLFEFSQVSTCQKPIECHYHDGGPDHNIRHMRNKLANIAYFLNRDLDLLCSVQTPPYHSWKNPCERCMSLLNLGLQGVGIMRQETKTCETYLKSASNLKQIRKLKEKHPEIVEEISEALRPTKELMGSVLGRLSLKGEPLQVFSAASMEDIASCCEALRRIDDTFDSSCLTNTSVKMRSISDKMAAFMATHCRERHYLFSIRKCDSQDCVCGDARLPTEVFREIHHLPDPVPSSADKEKYQKFDEIYGKDKSDTIDQHLPSKHAESKKHGMPFSPAVQYLKNTKLVVMCDECQRWRCVYSKKKLQKEERREAIAIIECISYSCGSSLHDIHMFESNDPQDTEEGQEPDAETDTVLAKLHMSKKLTCISPMEVPYYGVFTDEPLCYHCGSETLFPAEPKVYFPMCELCKNKGLKLQERPRKAKKAEKKQ